MKKTLIFSMAVTLIASITIEAKPARRAGPRNKSRVIIRYKTHVDDDDIDNLGRRGARIRHVYSIIPAVAAEIDDDDMDDVEVDDDVEFVEPDIRIYALDTELDNSWAVKHIGAGNIHPYNKGAGVKVAIIDTGIDLNHDDLAVAGNVTFVNGTTTGDDDHGHGTHCAGIVAALDNDRGVVGVAPEASLYAVKVLDASGSGYLSDVVAGIQWSINNGMDIISMSLGTNLHSTTLQDACDSAYGSGIILVAAAGNDYRSRGRREPDTVDYPARYDSVIAVGATDDTDTKASFSSTGSALELVAPGVDIYSTYLGNSYATVSGTSMACPHVAGVAALVLASPYGGVRTRLQDTADDLGGTGWDKWYGYGLIDADEAAGAPAGPPVADFMGDSTSGDAPLTVHFMDLSTGDIESWEWVFGDGGSSTQRDPSHVYTNAGTYTVSLEVTGPGGSDTKEIIDYIEVTTPPPPPTLVLIAVTPEATSIEIGSTRQYTAIGTYSDDSTADITNDVTWASSNSGVATIDASGLAEGKGVGITDITASLDSITSNTATLNVTELPSEIEVFSDSFESSADWTANWSQDSQNDWRRRTSRKKEGNYAAEVDGRATDAQLISRDIDLQGKTNTTITFWWFIESGLDRGEYLAFDVSVDGGENWGEMASLNGNVDLENTWHNVSIDVTAINNLRIRFRGTMSSSREDAYLDVVKVVAW